MLLNIVDDGRRNEITDTHLTAQKQANLGATDIVLDELLNDVDVVLPGLETGKGLIYIGTTALNDKRLGRN